MSHRTWMAFYVADYLADTAHLCTMQHGAYMLLIMHYWRRGELPDDDTQLAQICRMTPEVWAVNKPILQGLFLDGWRHKRIDEELAEAEEKHRKRVEAGSKGGRPEKQCLSNAYPENKQSPPQSQSQSQRKKEDKKRASRIPENWKPTSEGERYALTTLGSPESIKREIENFRDYWQARAGSGAVKLDWEATWRTWCRNAVKFGGGKAKAGFERHGPNDPMAGII